MVSSLSFPVTYYWACVCAFEHQGVHFHMKKRLKKGRRTAPYVRMEHGAVQCKVQSLPRSLSLSFKCLPLGLLRGKKNSALLTSLPCSLSPSLTSFLLSLPSLGTFQLYFFELFLSASLFSPAPWLFCFKAKMGPPSLDLLDCSEWTCQYAYLIHPFSFFFCFVPSNEQSSAAAILWCI